MHHNWHDFRRYSCALSAPSVRWLESFIRGASSQTSVFSVALHDAGFSRKISICTPSPLNFNIRFYVNSSLVFIIFHPRVKESVRDVFLSVEAEVRIDGGHQRASVGPAGL